MAKNLDVQIDTASFLDSIRPEMPPSAARMEKPETSSVPKENAADKKRVAKSESRKKPAAASVIPPIENEEDYLEMFIKSTSGPGTPSSPKVRGRDSALSFIWKSAESSRSSKLLRGTVAFHVKGYANYASFPSLA